MPLSRRSFITGMTAAALAPAIKIVPAMDAMRAYCLDDALISFCFNTGRSLDDARLVLPDTNRFRFLSDGD
jgi:hypothetical protein